MRSEQQLMSMLDDKPCFYYHPRSNTVICYWRGVAMTRKQAIALIGRHWGMTWATKEISEVTWIEYLNAYKMGAFGDANWDNRIGSSLIKSNHIDRMGQYVAKRDEKFFPELVRKYSREQVLEWIFDTDYAVID